MKWLELKLDTSPAGLDPVSQLLEEQGITELVIDDEGDFRDFLEHNHQYWDYVDEELMQEKQGLCRITFYLSDDPEGYHRLAQVRMSLSQLKAASSAVHGGVRDVSRNQLRRRLQPFSRKWPLCPAS